MKVRQILKQAAKRGVSVAVVVLMLVSCCFSASAATFVPYTTYTYDFEGNHLESPHAYVADQTMKPTDMGLGLALANPNDMFIDKDGFIYIVDTDNNRVVFFDQNMQSLGYLNEFYNATAVIPKIKEELTTEADAAEKALEIRNKKYEDAEEDPAKYDLKLEEFYGIEERVAATAEDAREDEYNAILQEEAFAGRTMPDYTRFLEFIEKICPFKFEYDSVPQEDIDAIDAPTEEERHYMAYYENFIAGSSRDPSGDSLNAPTGIFVDTDKTIYIADTGNKRVLRIKHEGEGWESSGFEVTNTFMKPDSAVLDKDFEFLPANLVVDSAGRMYVNVKNVNSGIMQLSAEGEFMGYYGAQQVSGSVLDWFFRLFQTEEQRAKSVRIVPRVYNNIAIDSKNFVWVTADSMDSYDLVSYLKSGDSGTAPVKRLNLSGNDVLVRNGVWAPGGDIPAADVQDVSGIVDVAIKGDTGIYTLVDAKHQKLFTYDVNGNLLYAFGGTGSQLGVFQMVAAAVYQGTDLLVLDKNTGYVTRLKQTDYAVAIEDALNADKARDYAGSEVAWKKVQKLNANFDLAYIGLAKCYVREAAKADDAAAKDLYQTAMEYYKLARNTEGYSKAFKEYRSLYVRDHLLLVLAVPITLLVLIYFAIRAINKVNKRAHVTGTATTLPQELCYGWRAIFHPIAGFWEIKREKRGTMRAAFIFLALAVVAFCYHATGTAYLFNNQSAENISLLQQAANVVIPVVLWVLASWSFTTLMSGEGSMKDIFIALCYGLIPMILLLIPVTVASNICSLDEQAFLTFFTSLAYVWMGLLIVFGSMVVQDYTFSKNLLTVVLSVLGMAAIMFIVLLLISLTGKMFGFVQTLYQEIAYRL